MFMVFWLLLRNFCSFYGHDSNEPYKHTKNLAGVCRELMFGETGYTNQFHLTFIPHCACGPSPHEYCMFRSGGSRFRETPAVAWRLASG